MSTLIVQPVIALLSLTFLVWCYMYYLRLGYVITNNISAQKLETPEQCNSVLPASVNKPSNNLKNLFEMPIIFYTICILSTSLQLVDSALVYLAWAYVILRITHSIFHCFSPSVNARFYAYFFSSIVLWTMLAKFIYDALVIS